MDNNPHHRRLTGAASGNGPCRRTPATCDDRGRWNRVGASDRLRRSLDVEAGFDAAGSESCCVGRSRTVDAASGRATGTIAVKHGTVHTSRITSAANGLYAVAFLFDGGIGATEGPE